MRCDLFRMVQIFFILHFGQEIQIRWLLKIPSRPGFSQSFKQWELLQVVYALLVTLFFQDLKCDFCSAWVVSPSQEQIVILASFAPQFKIIFSLGWFYLKNLSTLTSLLCKFLILNLQSSFLYLSLLSKQKLWCFFLYLFRRLPFFFLAKNIYYRT